MSNFTTPWPQFFDVNGDPLVGYYIYFGDPDQDPITFPKNVFDTDGNSLGAVVQLNSKGQTVVPVELSGTYSMSIYTDLTGNGGALYWTHPNFAGLLNQGDILTDFWEQSQDTVTLEPILIMATTASPLRTVFDYTQLYAGIPSDNVPVFVLDGSDYYINADLINLSNKNYLINGGMSVWQRGTSFTTGNEYTADRWNITSNVTSSRSTDISSDSISPYSNLVTGTAGSKPFIRQGIELPIAGNAGVFKSGDSLTLSFLAKGTASSDFKIITSFRDTVASNTNEQLDQVDKIVGTADGSWNRYEYTWSIAATPAGTNTLYYVLIYADLANDNFRLADVQLESGTKSTAFEYRTQAEELALCQRYFQKTYPVDIAPGTVNTQGLLYQRYAVSVNSSAVHLMWGFAVVMRGVPSITTYASDGTVGKITEVGQANVDSASSATGDSRTTVVNNAALTNVNSFYQAHAVADAEL